MRILLWLCVAWAAWAQPPTELWTRGYSVIPSPRNVRLGEGDIVLDSGWRIVTGRVSDRHVAVTTLRKDLEGFHALKLGGGDSGPAVRLSLQPGAVPSKAEPEIDRQAYRLRIENDLIEVTGNGDPGLFYGVQTLIQLVKRDAAGRLLLPKGTIDDWPSFQLRFLHWDTKHHQDRMETLKRYLDWAARFKVNMIGFELEDKFEYPSHPNIGAPGAFTTAQLQEIVNYGLERYIQVVPEIQAPAHLSYVLKHPQFADLRADGNNYQACLCDPRSYDLIFSMYDDALQATRGVDYVFVSTDEVYYAGIGARCDKPYNPVNRSLRWVEFVQRAHDFLQKRGRKMLIWAEYPLLAEHVPQLPRGIIDGVIGEVEYLPAERARDIRQLAYVSMQGSELLFPDHFRGESPGRLESAFRDISFGKVWQGHPIGVFGAAWDDSGLHNETFWLGWSAVAQYGWTPGTPSVEQHTAEFMRLYYGPAANGMIEIYRSMQRQARAWERSWDRVVSRLRGPGYGNSDGKGIGTVRRDLTLSPPELPRMPDLKVEPSFANRYRERVAEARNRAMESDQLIHSLQANFARVERNHYNLEVFLALAKFMRHHWTLLLGLERAEQRFVQASKSAKAEQAVGSMVEAYNTVGQIEREAERVFRELQSVFEKSQYPKGRSVGAKQFVQVFDDTKDHWAARTADLSYLMAPEQSIGLTRWRKELLTVIQDYAKEHDVPVKGLREQRLEQ